MSLTQLEQKNLSSKKGNFWLTEKVSMFIWAFVLSTNLALADVVKPISVVNFRQWRTAELFLDKEGKYYIQCNNNSKTWDDFISGTTIINWKKYIVFSPWETTPIEVFLESDLEIYKEYNKKYGEENAFRLVKAREEYLSNYMKDNPVSKFASEEERNKKALESWEFILEKIK